MWKVAGMAGRLSSSSSMAARPSQGSAVQSAVGYVCCNTASQFKLLLLDLIFR